MSRLFILIAVLFFVSACAHKNDSSNPDNIDRNGIRQMFMAHFKELQACYETALITNKSLSGKLVLDFDIGETGVVKRAALSKEKSTLTDPMMTNCVLIAMKSWKFSEPPSNKDVQVFYPMMFKTAGPEVKK